MVAPYRDAPPLTQRPRPPACSTSPDVAPGMQPDFIAFPGTRFSSEHHYAVFMKAART
jgi:hypothetical protein